MIIGIDLGTTNSLVAIWDSSEAKVIPNSLGKFLTPSVVSISETGILIGEPALNRMVTHPELSVSNFKRTMGSDKIYKLGDLSFRSEELSALILKRLKEDAEAYLGYPITEAVISVPAYFSDAQRKATKIAGKLAGLKVERLINEPTAAGIAYGLREQANETSYLIFDLGGGTFDVSIISLFSGIMEVRASSGDNFLGGVDFTSILEKIFVEKLKNGLKMGSNNFPIDKHNHLPLELQEKIREQAEIAKHNISLQEEVLMTVNWKSEKFQYQFNNKDFESAAEPLLKRLYDPVKKTLNDAKFSPSQVQQVVLVGGACRMALVKKIVSRMFGRLPLCHIDPDIVVALGCAIQAGLKENHQSLDEIVVTDVCPYSLGVAVYKPNFSNGTGLEHFDPILERNVVIPTSKSRVYFPVSENQKFVDIKIYQGENFFLAKNVFLGNLKLEFPIGLKNAAFEIRFSYDINGLLEVEATILETNERKNIVIEGNPGVLSEKEIEERLESLKKLKIHPREKSENLLALSHAERLYQDLHGDQRNYLSRLINEFMEILEHQDDALILKARTELEKVVQDVQNQMNLILS